MNPSARRVRPIAVAIGAIACLHGTLAAPAGLTAAVRSGASGPAAGRPVAAESLAGGRSGSAINAVSNALTPDVGGSWGSVMDWGLQAKHMSALPNGKVLVWSTGSNAAVWDPGDGSFAAAPALFGDLHCAGQSMLADGRVIVVGGQNGAPHIGTTITSIYDPTTSTWMHGPDMAYFRWYATSTTLPDGRVLATSGDAPDGTRATIPEIYDPVANTWTKLTGASRSQSLYPLMFVLPNGRVFEAGPGSSTAILDPTGTGSWTAGPSNAYSTSGYSESAVMYAPGKIIRAGGGDPAISRATVIDMTAASPAWRDVAPMAFPRRRMNLTILADGTVLAMGGTRAADDANQAVLEGEIWNPSTEQWTTVAPMAEARMYHSSAVLLADGRVLIGGGEAAGRLRAQVYSPPYLFQGARPTISSAPSAANYGSSFSITTPNAASITSVALIRLSAATHAFDQNQRYVPLAFSVQGGSLSVTAPASGGVAPPGPYELVIKNGAGVPSVASFIRIDTNAGLQPGTIHGTVTDSATNAPINGVTITNGPRSTTTAANGTYPIANVPSGEQTITFAAGGYATATRTQTVAGGGDYQVDVALVPPGTVTGHVTDATTGSAIAGATISYPGGETSTDANGAYVINGIAAGTQTIAASAALYVTGESSAVVPAGGTTTLDFALQQSPTFITGSVTDSVSGQPLVGATVSIPGATTTTNALGGYRFDVSPGTYSVTATAAGHDAMSHDAIVSLGTYSVTDFSLVTTPSSSATLTFPAAADAYVSKTSPTKNYGGVDFRIRNGTTASPSTYVSYLRFAVSGLAGRSVTAAKVRLFNTDSSVDGGRLYAAGDGWTETGITWNNAPTRGSTAVGTAGRVVKSTWADVALTPAAIPADGSYTLALVSASTDSAYYSSRSGTNPPVLELTVGGPPPPPPDGPVAAFTVTPSSGPAPLSVKVADTSTGSPATWLWDFGDTSTSTLTAPAAHVYSTPGTYVISLKVTNTNGTSTTSHSVTATSGPPPSSRLATMSFEAGKLVDSATGATKVSGTVTLDTTSPLAGTASANIAASSTAYLEKSWTAANDAWIVANVRLAALPTSAVRILQIQDQGTTIGNLQLQTSGALRLRNNSTSVGGLSTPLQIGVSYRIAIHQGAGTGANAVLEGFVARTGDAFGPAFGSLTNGTWTTKADRLRIGATSGGALSITMDDVLVDGASMPALAAPQFAGVAVQATTISSRGGVAARSWTGTATRAAVFVCVL
ncbi:MAG TPA: carboxypeptidase regulatory-like domain-containing protein [Candidatus Limnocylindrales bacterium]|nr:carboxypeptidase regulatory-like domain-containing protein [Candidatus Limnocylindrales bacterium]